MRLRTRLNLVVAGLSAAFVIVLIATEVQSTRNSVREEIEAANRVASQLLGRLAAVYSQVGGPDLVLQFLQQLGRVRANEVSLQSAAGRGPVPITAGDLQGRARGACVVCASSGAATGEIYVSAARRRAAGGASTAFARRSGWVG